MVLQPNAAGWVAHAFSHQMINETANIFLEAGVKSEVSFYFLLPFLSQKLIGPIEQIPCWINAQAVWNVEHIYHSSLTKSILHCTGEKEKENAFSKTAPASHSLGEYLY